MISNFWYMKLHTAKAS